MWYDGTSINKGTNHGSPLFCPRPCRPRCRRICHGHGLAARPLTSASQRRFCRVCIAALQQVGDPPERRYTGVSGRRRHLEPKKHSVMTPLSFRCPLPPRRVATVALCRRPATTIAAHPACTHAPARPRGPPVGLPGHPTRARVPAQSAESFSLPKYLTPPAPCAILSSWTIRAGTF